jgi:hypothetical protein
MRNSLALVFYNMSNEGDEVISVTYRSSYIELEVINRVSS